MRLTVVDALLCVLVSSCVVIWVQTELAVILRAGFTVIALTLALRTLRHMSSAAIHGQKVGDHEGSRLADAPSAEEHCDEGDGCEPE
jgi:hypothetical protein